MPKKANIKQKKTEHHIQILPTQDENGEYTIPPEVKQKILNSSTGKGNFVFTIFSQEERKGCNCTGKSSSGADVEPLNPFAHFRGNLGPELFYPLNQFILGFGFHMFSQIPLHGTPKVLNWVEIQSLIKPS